MNRVQSKRMLVVWLVGIVVLAQMASGAQDPNGVIPNDPLFPLQWYLHNTGQNGGTPGVDINAVKAWEITTGDPNITVAVVGEGIDLDHPDLVNNLVPGRDFYDKDDSPEPGAAFECEYQTGDAGLIAGQGNNGIGVTGVTWNCKIMPVRTARMTSEYWADVVSEADEAAAFRWAATEGADILVFNWIFNGAQPTVRSALVDITKPGGIGRNGKGCVFVTAAHGDPSVAPGYVYLGMYPETISVEAVDPCDRLWWREAGSRVDLVAPSGCPPALAGASAIPMWTTDISGPNGANAYSTTDTNLLDYTDRAMGPTSLVAGVAALILSVEPNLASDEVRHYLCRSAHDLGEPGRDDLYGWGRVDALAALNMVLAKRADLNNDWKVDEEDRAILMKAIDTNDLSADIAPAKKRDGVVDANDLELLTRYLGTVIPEVGLLAHWKLDETEGMTAHDSEGENDATVVGTPLWQPEGGKVGGALQLTGAANFIMTKLARDPSQNRVSVFAWVKGGAPGQAILSQMGGSNWLKAGSPDGALTTDLKSAGRLAESLTSAVVITDGNWHRVGLSWDGSNRVLYVDDVEVAKDTQPNLPSSTGGLYIGGGSKLAAGTFWSGLIDDVRVYSRAVKP